MMFLESDYHPPDYLFVYGTLLRKADSPLHPAMQRYAGYISDGIVEGKLFEIDGYPGLVKRDHHNHNAFHLTAIKDHVHGELYKMTHPKDLLHLLDRYKGCAQNSPEPREYCRELSRVTLASGEQLMAWLYRYLLPVSTKKAIPGGNYLDFLQSLRAE